MSFEDDDFGSVHLLDLEPGHIRPQTLDKEINLTPLIRERGGSIKINDGYGWKDEAQLDFLFDDDETTAFSGIRGAVCAVLMAPRGEEASWMPSGAIPLRNAGISNSIWAGRLSSTGFDFFGTPRRGDTFFRGPSGWAQTTGMRSKTERGEIKLTWRGKAFVDWDVVVERLENTDAVLDFQLPLEARANPHIRGSSGQMGNRRVADFWHGVGSLCQLHFRVLSIWAARPCWRIDLVRQPITDRAHRPDCPRWRHVRSQYVLAFYLQRG